MYADKNQESQDDGKIKSPAATKKHIDNTIK